MAIACATAGIIIGVVTLTGLGLKLANGLVDLAGGNLLLTLIFTMITSLILGMGAPTTANYIIGGLMLIDPATWTDVVGLVMLGLGVFYQWQKWKSLKTMGIAG